MDNWQSIKKSNGNLYTDTYCAEFINKTYINFYIAWLTLWVPAYEARNLSIERLSRIGMFRRLYQLTVKLTDRGVSLSQ